MRIRFWSPASLQATMIWMCWRLASSPVISWSLPDDPAWVKLHSVSILRRMQVSKSTCRQPFSHLKCPRSNSHCGCCRQRPESTRLKCEGGSWMKAIWLGSTVLQGPFMICPCISTTHQPYPPWRYGPKRAEWKWKRAWAWLWLIICSSWEAELPQNGVSSKYQRYPGRWKPWPKSYTFLWWPFPSSIVKWKKEPTRGRSSLICVSRVPLNRTPTSSSSFIGMRCTTRKRIIPTKGLQKSMWPNSVTGL